MESLKFDLLHYYRLYNMQYNILDRAEREALVNILTQTKTKIV